MQLHCHKLVTICVVVLSLLMEALGQTQSRRTTTLALLDQNITPSFVTLFLDSGNGRTSVLGVGFFVNVNVVATSYNLVKHIKNPSLINIKVTGKKLTYKVTKYHYDASRQIALLAISKPVGFPLYMGNSGEVSVGESVFLPIKSATGRITFSEGIYKGVEQVKGKCSFQYSLNQALPLSIGTPVINHNEDVIGIVTDFSATNPSQTFITPVSQLARVIVAGENSGLSKRSPVIGGVEGGLGEELSRKKNTCLFTPYVRPEPPLPSPPPPASAKPTIINISGDVVAGGATRRVEPVYPPLAKAAGIEGAVVVEITINKKGDVISARALSGHPLLKDTAVEAAHGWKFKPELVAGKPVKVIGTITFNFNL